MEVGHLMHGVAMANDFAEKISAFELRFPRRSLVDMFCP
jgi:hypothetical protein